MRDCEELAGFEGADPDENHPPGPADGLDDTGLDEAG